MNIVKTEDEWMYLQDNSYEWMVFERRNVEAQLWKSWRDEHCD